MRTLDVSALTRSLLLVVVASVPLVFGLQGCSGGKTCAGGPCYGTPPPNTVLLTCPPTGTNPPGGFCVAAEDINSNGVAFPHLKATITGAVTSPLSNPVGTNEGPFSFANPTGWPQYVSGGMLNAAWDGTEIWGNEPWCPGDETLQQWSGGGNSGSITAQSSTWPIFTCDNFTSTQEFFLVGSLPSTITLQASGLTTANGMPQLEVVATDFGLVSTSLATSVAANGSSATFAFPTYGGAALLADDYTFLISNQTSSGVFSPNAVGFFSIGTPSTSYTTPFGIDLADYAQTIKSCTIEEEGVVNSPGTSPGAAPATTIVDVCNTSGSSTPAPTPAVTSFSGGTLSYRGRTYTVGSQPTAVRVFDNKTVISVTANGENTTTTTTTGPLYALTTNFGSNTVSIATLASGAVSSISVGTEPMTAVLDAAQAYGYVANYGSASVSQIDLSTFAATQTITVGASPSALAMDPTRWSRLADFNWYGKLVRY